MVVAAFPLAKLGFLLLKQLSKPVANYIKNEAKKHPYVRKYVIIPTGRAFHKLDKTNKSKKISDTDAVELGANALGEIVLFTLLSTVLILELSRQSDKKATIQRNKDEEIVAIKESIADLYEEIEVLTKKVKFIEVKLRGAISVLEMEDFKHVADNNFLDIRERKGTFFKKRGKEIFDDSA